MKKFFKVLGIVLGVAILLVLAAAAFIHFRGIPSYDPPTITEMKIEVTPERLDRGQKIAGMLCVHCHNGPDGNMTGRKLTDLPAAFGEIYSMNITHDPEIGIGKWTDGELVHFLRTGLRKNGKYAPSYMPKFPLASDEDIKSLVVWLRSDDPILKANKTEPEQSKPGFLTKFLCNMVPALKPLPLPKEPINQPDTANQLALGKYLANGLYGCFACHSKDFATNNDLEPEKSEGFYAGGNTLIDLKGNKILSKNITPDAATGIGTYTEEEFINVMLNGKRKNGKQIRYPMLPYTRLTEGEVKAMYAYLKTLPPISNQVPD